MKLHLLCLLAALPLIASDDQPNHLTCICTGKGSDCKDGLCTVDKGGACVVVAAETTLGNTKVSGTYRTCMSKADSCREGEVSFTVNEKVYWRSNTTCCTSDRCNEKDLEVQPAESTLGNVHCLSCFGTNSSTCKPVKQQCAESEKHCLTIHGFVITDNLLQRRKREIQLEGKATKEPSTTKDTTTATKPTTKEPSTTKDTTTATKPTTKETSTTKDTRTATKTTKETSTTKDTRTATKTTTKEPHATKKKVTFFVRGCGTKEGIVGSGIPLTLGESTFHFSHGNPSLVPGSLALTILLPALIGLLLDKFLY